MIRDQGVTFILIRPSGEMLMQLRDDGCGQKIEYPNMWCFPGGGIEENEKPISAAVREIKEEYSIDVREDNCELLMVYDHDYNTDYVFVCKVNSEMKPTLGEGADMRWMEINEIKKLPLAWEQNKIIPTVEKYLVESLKSLRQREEI